MIKLLIFGSLLVLSGCRKGIEDAFFDARTKDTCYTVKRVAYLWKDLGNFVICTEESFKRRTK